MMSTRSRYTALTSIALVVVYLSTQHYRSAPTLGIPDDILHSDPAKVPDTAIPPLSPQHTSIQAVIPPTLSLPGPPFYKPTPSGAPLTVVDNFPLAAAASSSADLPPLPKWNEPPRPHVKESTPLFIGFTRNWRLLQQVVVSYITSGWPSEDIYVVENTGVMDSNTLGLLSLQNPFFLNHTRLSMLGVNVLVTPTILTFAQLQNFYLWTATQNSWSTYFWSHMDLVSVSLESEMRFPPASVKTETTSVTTREEPLVSSEPWENNTLYMNCVHHLRTITSPEPSTNKVKKWASLFFSYDRLALVNVAAHKSIGAWDTMIPFYLGDCDMHSRITMAGYEILDATAGLVYDVGSSLDDISVLHRQKRGPTGVVPEAQFQDPNEKKERLERRGLWANAKETETETEQEKALKEQAIKEAKAALLVPIDASAGLAADKLAALFVPTSAPAQPIAHAQPRPSAQKWTPDTPASETYHALLSVLDHMQNSKNSGERNTWQARQSGGQGDPFYRDSAGFEKGIQMTIEHGRAIYREKWGHRDCDIVQQGYRADDAWRVERDWDRAEG